MVISGTAQTSTDELAEKCYGMMKKICIKKSIVNF